MWQRIFSSNNEVRGGRSSLITLYTPNTGFIDADAKIAFGLARVALEIADERKFTIAPRHGYYEVILDIEWKNHLELDEAFKLLCSRMLSSERRYMLPGIAVKYRKKYMDRIADIADDTTRFSLVAMYRNMPRGESSLFALKCRHTELPTLGGIDGGFILAFSGHAGKPYSRDKVSNRKNLGMCIVCSALAMLGIHSSSIEVNIGKNRVTMFPLPLTKIEIENFNYLVSAVKTFQYYWFNDMPAQLIPLVVITHHPQLASALSQGDYVGHIHLFQEQKGAWTVRGSTATHLSPFVSFTLGKPFNQATVSKMVSRSQKRQNKIEPLLELLHTLSDGNLAGQRLHAVNFSRAYVKELTQEWGDPEYNLLYPETVKYLLIDVGKVNQSLINNNSIFSVARMLNYYVRNRNYSYVDNIRNARDTLTFKDTIVKALREAQTRLAANEHIHIPSSTDIQEIVKMAETENMFVQVKMALAILALSFIVSREEKGGEK